MADDQASNDINDGGDAPELSYDDEVTTTVAIAEEVKTTVTDDYVDEPIEDYVVNLVVNEQPDGVSPSDLADAAITDMQGNLIPSKTTAMIDAINDYSSTIYDELSTSTAAVTGGKRWWGKFIKQNK